VFLLDERDATRAGAPGLLPGAFEDLGAGGRIGLEADFELPLASENAFMFLSLATQLIAVSSIRA
jgi:hypothetical protein